MYIVFLQARVLCSLKLPRSCIIKKIMILKKMKYSFVFAIPLQPGCHLGRKHKSLSKYKEVLSMGKL